MSEIEQVSPEENAYRAYVLRAKGKNWQEIAKELGYPDASAAARNVNHFISKARDSISDDRKAEIINLELFRLDALQAAVWDMAIAGDTKSVDSVLKVMAHRARLLQLGEESHTTNRTVIITDSNYVARLKELAEE